MSLKNALTLDLSEIASNEFARKLVYGAAIDALATVGFDEERAKHVIEQNAANLQKLSTVKLTMDQAAHLEAAATVIRFGVGMW